jgi:hypothetical protein
MSKKLENLEKWIAFMLLAYAVGLLIGETIRDEVYRGKKAPGLLGAFYPPPAPAPAEAQAIFEAHPAGPGPVQGHRPRPCPISCLKVSYPSTRGLPVDITSANTFIPAVGVPPAQNYPRGWLSSALSMVNSEPQIQALCWFLNDLHGDTQWENFSLTRRRGRLVDAA